jgi:hypothetical protein
MHRLRTLLALFLLLSLAVGLELPRAYLDGRISLSATASHSDSLRMLALLI